MGYQTVRKMRNPTRRPKPLALRDGTYHIQTNYGFEARYAQYCLTENCRGVIQGHGWAATGEPIPHIQVARGDDMVQLKNAKGESLWEYERDEKGNIRYYYPHKNEILKNYYMYCRTCGWDQGS